MINYCLIFIGQSIAVAYKFLNEYTQIWSDRGSGADEDVSIWQPVKVDNDYFPLGDTATPSHGKPSKGSLMVTALVPDALAPPTGFNEIWNDRGSGADEDVRVMEMNAPSGYTCLGHVAVRGYMNTPDNNHYR